MSTSRINYLFSVQEIILVGPKHPLFQQYNIVFKGRYYFLLYFLKSRAEFSKAAHQALLSNPSSRPIARAVKLCYLQMYISTPSKIPLTSYFYSLISHTQINV